MKHNVNFMKTLCKKNKMRINTSGPWESILPMFFKKYSLQRWRSLSQEINMISGRFCNQMPTCGYWFIEKNCNKRLLSNTSVLFCAEMKIHEIKATLLPGFCHIVTRTHHLCGHLRVPRDMKELQQLSAPYSDCAPWSFCMRAAWSAAFLRRSPEWTSLCWGLDRSLVWGRSTSPASPCHRKRKKRLNR